MTLKNALRVGAAAFALSATAANASTTINLIDLGGVTGSQAEIGFRIAARYWADRFTNNATINLGVSFAPLAPNVIGSTGSARADISVAQWQALVNSTKSNSTIDQNVVLPTLTGGGFTALTTGLNTAGRMDSRVTGILNGTQVASQVLWANTSLLKAIGAGVAPGVVDGNVTFSSNFAFDFDPSDGITPGTFDFIGVAIHEIGHALGFVSGVDLFDFYAAPNGPGRNSLPVGYSFNNTSIFSALDMFRYAAPGLLDLRIGNNPYFSFDGGVTALYGNTFSTGRYNGDGNQASHWKDAPNCQVGNGIMDPTFCFGQEGFITGLDLAAYDAMGWNLSSDALTYGAVSTGDIYNQLRAVVPEPGTWGMMILGFGFIGSVMRRRKAAVRVTYA